MRGTHLTILLSLLIFGVSQVAKAQDGAEKLVDAARSDRGNLPRYAPSPSLVATSRCHAASAAMSSSVPSANKALDLQLMVHDDMAAHFSAYPANWGLKHPDPNIDHRRVLNLATWLKRQGKAIAVSRRSGDYVAGDIVTWRLPGGQPHIGIVSDRRDAQTGTPLIIHNIGRGTQEEKILFAYDITGHFRYFR